MYWLMLVLLFHLLLICSKCNKLINITSQYHLLDHFLDCCLLFNLFFTYILITTRHFDVNAYCIVAIMLFTVTFFVVLVYHILFITDN